MAHILKKYYAHSEFIMVNGLKCKCVIDKQKALRHDCIYSIENTEIETGVSRVY